MNTGAGELRQVGEMTLLTGGLGRRNPKQSMCKRFVICENSKLSTFKHESEVAERRVSREQFTVKGKVFLLCIRERLGIECQTEPINKFPVEIDHP